MNWNWRKLFGFETKAGLADPETWLSELFGSTPTAAGIVVSPLTAMRSTPVRAAVQAIAEPVGQLPLHLYRREGDARIRDTSHPAAKVLAHPNDWTGAQDFREQLQRDCLLWGNGYAFIGRAEGRPVELIRLAPNSVSVTADETTGEPIYRSMSVNNANRVLPRANVFHIKAPSLDGLKGESPVTQCREAIALALTMEAHAARLFGQGARPSGILSFKGNMTPDALTKARQAWQAAHGAGKSGGTAVMPGDSSWQALTFKSVDAQFLELWQHAVTEIARVYRVPPHMLFELGRATWGNASEMGSAFVTFTLMRWLKAWQSEISLKLLGEEEREVFYAEFQTNDFLKADLSARAQAYSTMIAARVLNPNECRCKENLPPYEGGDEFQNPNITVTTQTTGPARARRESEAS